MTMAAQLLYVVLCVSVLRATSSAITQPCKDAKHFTPTKALSSYCDGNTHETLAKEVCVKHGCEFDQKTARCGCVTESSCKAAGGRYGVTYTCESANKMMGGKTCAQLDARSKMMLRKNWGLKCCGSHTEEFACGIKESPVEKYTACHSKNCPKVEKENNPKHEFSKDKAKDLAHIKANKQFATFLNCLCTTCGDSFKIVMAAWEARGEACAQAKTTVGGSSKPSSGGSTKPPSGELKRKVRKIATKGTDCGKIPENAKLTKKDCEEKKESLLACAKKAGDKVKTCAKLRKLKTRKIKKKRVKFAQKLKGIDFSKPDDPKTIKKKAKYEETVLKLYKATSGVFTYTEDKSRARRKLSGEKTYTANADLDTNSDADSDDAKKVSASAVAEELKKDEDFKDVTVEGSAVEVEEIEVEEIVEEDGLLSMSATTSITTVFVFGLMSMMDF